MVFIWSKTTNRGGLLEQRKLDGKSHFLFRREETVLLDLQTTAKGSCCTCWKFSIKLSIFSNKRSGKYWSGHQIVPISIQLNMYGQFRSSNFEATEIS